MQFTDGTAEGKLLSLKEAYKKIEELENSVATMKENVHFQTKHRGIEWPKTYTDYVVGSRTRKKATVVAPADGFISFTITSIANGSDDYIRLCGESNNVDEKNKSNQYTSVCIFVRKGEVATLFVGESLPWNGYASFQEVSILFDKE